MPTKQHFYSEFVSENGMYYRVEIWHKTTEVLSSTEFTLDSGGFDLRYKKLSKPIQGGLLPSTCIVKFLVNDATELAAAHGVLSETNQSFYIRIKRSTDAAQNWNIAGLWWGGWVESGFDGYPDAPYPYSVDIKATDSLKRQLNKYNNQTDVASQSDYQDLSYPLQLIESKFELDTIPSTGDLFLQWCWQTDWWNYATGATPPADTNPVRKTYYNRAAFVTDPEDWPLTIQDPDKELKGVLKAFNFRVLMSQGKYWIQQANFLDETNPDPIISAAASGAGGEIYPTDVGYPADIAKEITIDNANNTPSTTDGGVIKVGAKFSQRNDAHSVRAKYIFGSQFCPFSPNIDYTAGLTTLGFLAQGTGANLSLFLNVKMQQTFPLTGGSAVTPISSQGENMTGMLAIRLKVGNKYLKQQAGALSEYQLEWTTTESILTITTGSGTYYDNMDGVTTTQDLVANSLAQFGNGYPYPFTKWENNVPATGTATATARFFLAGVPLPDLGSTYGEVQFEIVNTSSYIFYWTTNTPYTNIWQNFYIDPADDPNGEGWLNNANPAASTNLDYNIGTSTPATPATQTITNGLAPYLSDLQIAEELDTSEDAAPAGAQYMISQSGNELAPDIDLGSLKLGTNSSSNQITTLRAFDGTNYIAPAGFRSGSTGGFMQAGQLLVNEYFKTHSKPQIEISGTIISRDYEPHRTIKYTDQIGASPTRWIFCGGKFSPTKDEWAGSWHKLDIDSTAYTETEDIIYNPTTPTPPPSPEPSPDTGPIGVNTAPPLAANTEGLTTKLGFVLNDLIVGILDEDITAGVAITKVDLLSLKCKVYDNQTLILTNKQLRAGTLLTVDGDHSAAATQLNFDSISPSFDYTKGAVVMLRPYDLSNVITSENLYRGVTTTAIYIKSTDFHITTTSSVIMYTRDNVGAVQPSSYVSRSKVYATTYVPANYKVTTVDVYSSQNRNIVALTGRTTSDSTTSQGTGTANTTLILGSAWTSVEGDYFIISFEFGASTDEIYGAKITIEKV